MALPDDAVPFRTDAGRGSWLASIDLDPSSPWLAMGTKALGAEPWLIDDAHRTELLAFRGRLLSERRAEVMATPPSAGPAVDEVIGLVEAEGVAVEAGVDHPLARLG